MIKRTVINAFLVGLYLLLLTGCGPQQSGETGHEGQPNGLINETSPYLLQHAYNPVDWQPWGETALHKAQDKDQLLIISIGYAACHWCHVMEKESFSDSATAKLMNDNYVSIKVDREERPDVDQVYMDAANLMTGRGGWPLNIIALPDGKPVYAGTYFPKENWDKVLVFFRDAYQNDRQKILDQAEQVTQGLATIDLVPLNEGEMEFSQGSFTSYSVEVLTNIDMRNGGRKGAPKFPTPIVYETLMEVAYHSGNEQALDAAIITAQKMANGGIFDHLGGGFARYSTDGIWKVPHFEKMLYDNAQLISLYSHLYQLTGDDYYQTIVMETFNFLNRDLRDDNGGYYSSLDADSEGEEGKFYIWNASEIQEVLGEEAEVFMAVYQIEDEGNWEDNKNILYRSSDKFDRVARKLDMAPEEINTSVSRSREALLEIRDKRIPPPLDDKVLTSWNAMMISGLVDAYFAFNDEQYLEEALRTAEFLIDNQMRADGGLNRSYKDGRSSINGFLDDYGFTIAAFLKLYEATFDESWLDKAGQLTAYAKGNFLNEETQMFFYTSAEDDPLITRKTELADNVIPSSNSVMAHNLFKLGHYYYDEEAIGHARQMLQNMIPQITENAYYYSNWVRLYARMSHPYYEVAIVGDDATQKRNELFRQFIPNALIMGGQDEGSLELLENKLVDGKTMIYVCENKTCRLPVTDPSKARPLISAD